MSLLQRALQILGCWRVTRALFEPMALVLAG
jgi:hypothetical protein